MGIIVSFINAKGGVGKTTSASNVAAAIARAGKKVLLIDTDQSANATKAMCNVQIKKTITNLLRGSRDELPWDNEVVYPSVEENLDIIPSCSEVSVVELELVSEWGREMILKNALEEIKDQYDVIVIDTKPSLGVITNNVLCASDEIIIPVYESFSVDGMLDMFKILTVIKKRKMNPKLRIRGLLLTMYDPKTNMAKEIKHELVNAPFGAYVLSTTIPRNIDLAYCARNKQSIFQYAPYSKGAIAYNALAKELMEKWGML